MKTLFLLPFLFVSLHAAELDDLLGGFDTSIEVKEPEPVIESSEPSWFALRGDYTFSTAYNYQDAALIEGISRSRNAINLIMDMQLAKKWKSKVELKAHYDPIFSIRDIPLYTETLKDEAEIKEAYIQGTLGQFDLKVGRQITVWGKSDNIRITDVINPLDNRETGMVDIEDLRLPVLTSKLSYYLGNYAFNLSIIHESRVQKEADVGSEFFPTSMFPASFTVPVSSFTPTTQYAFSIDGVFSGWDLSLYAAQVFDQRWAIESGERLYHPMEMAGFALNVAQGSWLLKTEGAYLKQLHYSNISDEKSRLDLLIGAEYSGVQDVTLSLEIANRHIYDYETSMIGIPNYVQEDELQTALRASYVFDHDNATLTYLASMFGNDFELGGFERFWLEYALNDHIELSGGVIDYIGGEKPYFEAIKNNDRLFFDFKYSF